MQPHYGQDLRVARGHITLTGITAPTHGILGTEPRGARTGGHVKVTTGSTPPTAAAAVLGTRPIMLLNATLRYNCIVCLAK